MTPTPHYTVAPNPQIPKPLRTRLHPKPQNPKQKRNLQNPLNPMSSLVKSLRQRILQQSPITIHRLPKQSPRERCLGCGSSWVVPPTTVTLLRSAAPQKQQKGPRCCSVCTCVWRLFCVFVHLHKHTHTHTHTHTHIYIYIYIYMCVCVCVYEYLHIYIHMYNLLFVCLATCVCCICMHICTYVCIYIYIYIYIFI